MFVLETSAIVACIKMKWYKRYYYVCVCIEVCMGNATKNLENLNDHSKKWDTFSKSKFALSLYFYWMKITFWAKGVVKSTSMGENWDV